MKRTIVILTKSDKHSAYCVAGRDIETGKWIRLENQDRVMTDENLTTREGYVCRELDIVEVDCLNRLSDIEHQPENVYINENNFISKVGEMSWEEVIDKWGGDQSNSILGIPNGRQSVELEDRLVFYNRNNIPLRSLSIIEINNISFELNKDQDGNLRRHPKIRFTYINSRCESLEYSITITAGYQNNIATTEIKYDNAYLIVSLGEEYNKYVYLLGAKLIPIR